MQSTHNKLRGWLVAALMAVASAAFAQAPAQPGNPPAAATPAPPPAAVTDRETVENPYGLEALWKQGDFISRGTLIIQIGRAHV